MVETNRQEHWQPGTNQVSEKPLVSRWTGVSEKSGNRFSVTTTHDGFRLLG